MVGTQGVPAEGIKDLLSPPCGESPVGEGRPGPKHWLYAWTALWLCGSYLSSLNTMGIIMTTSLACWEGNRGYMEPVTEDLTHKREIKLEYSILWFFLREAFTLETEKTWVCIFVVSLSSCVALDKLPNLSESQFPPLSKRCNDTFVEDKSSDKMWWYISKYWSTEGAEVMAMICMRPLVTKLV